MKFTVSKRLKDKPRALLTGLYDIVYLGTTVYAFSERVVYY
jgi:hypothetical protein